MAKAFPTDDSFLRGYYAPLHMECDAPNLPISGDRPRELRGSLYRSGPNPQFAPRGRYHWFSGDGMIHAFHVADGRVAYRNRRVRTPKWQLEHDEGEGLSGSLMSRHLSDPRILELNSTVANTNVVWHGGRLPRADCHAAPCSRCAARGGGAPDGRRPNKRTPPP
ncbi:MAG: carotenoid oxygenase family protein [Burkholderiaceae bacterium]